VALRKIRNIDNDRHAVRSRGHDSNDVSPNLEATAGGDFGKLAGEQLGIDFVGVTVVEGKVVLLLAGGEAAVSARLGFGHCGFDLCVVLILDGGGIWYSGK
jgi:hypothetical protein